MNLASFHATCLVSVICFHTSHANKLVWEENFDGTSLDAKKWNIETGYLNVNGELENYQAENVDVENGNLVITAKKQQVGAQKYTSGRINTKGKFAFQYGRAEARIKLPLVDGVWPAFWMLGSDIDTAVWPKCGEIDIMEHVNTDDKVYGTLHWFANTTAYQGHAQYGTNTSVSNIADWHVYSTEWNDTYVRILVDNREYYRLDISDMSQLHMFHQPFYFTINVAVGGGFPGLKPVDESKLPTTMLVDYVKVYASDEVTTTTTPTTTTIMPTTTPSGGERQQYSMYLLQMPIVVCLLHVMQ